MADVTELISSHVRTMSDVFKKNHFNIPFYQRDYAWEKDQIDDFWSDLMDVVNGYQDNHFFGQIVTYNKDDVKDLIDGQQRLTTSSVLMAAINKIASELLLDAELTEDSKLDLREIRRSIKKSIMYDNLQPALRLQPVSSTDDSIQKYFIGLFNGIFDLNEHNKDIVPVQNLHSVFDKFTSQIKDYLGKNNSTEKIELLKDIYNAFMDKFFVSMISTRNQEDAFVIFETLNSRGKDLLPSEIIKTHLMSQIADEDAEVKSRFNDTWNEISAKFRKDSDKLTKYIRIYWAASHRLVSSKQLYRSISGEVRGVNATSKFLTDLDYLVDYYLAVSHSTKTKKDKEIIADPGVFSILNLLRKMRVTLHYPILFAMLLRKMSNDDMRIVLYKVLCVFIRHRAICMYGTNKLESGYANIAQKIWKQEIISPEQINMALDNSLLKDDIETENSFEALRMSNAHGAKGWTLKYMLFKLYQQNGDFEDKSVDDVNFSKYVIYHIADIDEVDESYYNYVGNYMLIEDIYSPLKYGAGEALRMSSLKTNQALGRLIGENGWNQDGIVARQNTFAGQSINIW